MFLKISDEFRDMYVSYGVSRYKLLPKIIIFIFLIFFASDSDFIVLPVMLNIFYLFFSHPNQYMTIIMH